MYQQMLISRRKVDFLTNVNSLTKAEHICVTKLGHHLLILLSSVHREAIIQPNAGLLSIELLGTYFNNILTKNKIISIYENWFENVVCKLVPILSRPRCLGAFGHILL